MRKQLHKTYFPFLSFALILAIGIAFPSCKKDRLFTDGDARLSFLTDTLTFDTLFVTLGSTTRSFTVRNPYNRTIEISNIFLAGGSNSSFRLNIDGDPVNNATDVQIPAKDSIYIFVEVTVDPGATDLPFLILDSVMFLTNGNQQRVVLQAYGQNARFFNGETIQSQTWTNELPYVVLNSLEVEAGHTLSIQKGVTVYFGGGSGLFVNGTLKVEGGVDTSDLVTFRGYRLDRQPNGVAYDDLPGQWLGVFLLRNSSGHDIHHLQMRGSQFGLNVGNTTLEALPQVSPANAPDLKITNTRIKNSSTYGLFGFLANIDAENLLIHDVGLSAVSLSLGGQYNFRHCTFFLRSSVFFDHRDPTLYLSNYHIFDRAQPPLKSAFAGNFTNCVIYGTLEDELLPDPINDTPFELLFDHCAVRVKGTLPPSLFVESLNNQDPAFRDIIKSNYNLTENSPLINRGKAIGVTADIQGTLRDGQPDIGAYEYKPE
jgi:hypothetical protein